MRSVFRSALNAELLNGDGARGLIERFKPTDTLRRDAQVETLAFLSEHEDAFQRDCDEGHLTASGIIVDASLSRTLLLFHPLYERWQQPGGHADGDTNLVRVALRESIEETGMADLKIWPEIVDVAVASGEGSRPHLHFDVRFLVFAQTVSEEPVSPEGLRLRWFKRDELIEPDISCRRRLMIEDAFALARELVSDPEVHPDGR